MSGVSRGARIVLLGGVAWALLASARLAAAGTFVVDATNDAIDAAPGDGVCAAVGGGCTLRAAIQESNSLAGADTITVPAGTYVLAIPGQGEGLAAKGDLDLIGAVTIAGAGAATTIIDANGLDRVFETSGACSISGLTMRGGVQPNGCGGGIRHPYDLLTLSDVIVTGNQAARGGGICNEPVFFGGAEVAMTNVVVVGNTATATGGGVVNQTGISGPPLVFPTSGLVSMTDCVIAENHAADGGGIAAVTHGFPAQVDVLRTTVRDNVATGEGGGVYELGGYGTAPVLHAVDSTISGNVAAVGGGVFGGALFEDSTLSGNRSDGDGGAVNVPSGYCEVRGSTITGNVADADADGSGDGGGLHVTAPYKCTVGNTILAANQDTGGEAPECAGGDLQSEGHNLLGSAAGCLVAGDPTGNIAGVDPELGPLAANGGSTLTHALLPGSPAIDAGLGCSATDQRGIARPQGPACDIGAVEQAYVATACGNGAIDGGEACDDGNVRDHDCCNHLCQLEAAGNACSDGNPCTDDTCDGGGACLAAANAAPCTDGSVCTVGTETCAAGACVVGPPLDCDDGNECRSDLCDAVSGCYHPGTTGNPCDDDNECTTSDSCHSGLCYGNAAPGPCDDDDACTTGDHCESAWCVGSDVLSCPAVCERCDPAVGCVFAPRDDCKQSLPQGSSVQVKDRSNPRSDQLQWHYVTVDNVAFGTSYPPSYDVCVFDETAGTASLAYGARPASGFCGAHECWQQTGRGWTYHDKAASAGGLSSIQLVQSTIIPGSKSKLRLKAKGMNFSVPTLPLSQDPSVILELREPSSGECWSSQFSNARKNTAADFKAKSD